MEKWISFILVLVLIITLSSCANFDTVETTLTDLTEVISTEYTAPPSSPTDKPTIKTKSKAEVDALLDDIFIKETARIKNQSEVDARIDEIFGGISLSDNEIKELAHYLTNTDLAIKIRNYQKALDQLDQRIIETKSKYGLLNDTSDLLDSGADVPLEEYIRIVADYLVSAQQLQEQYGLAMNLGYVSLYGGDSDLPESYYSFQEGHKESQTKLSKHINDMKIIFREALIDGMPVGAVRDRAFSDLEEVNKFPEKVYEFMEGL